MRLSGKIIGIIGAAAIIGMLASPVMAGKKAQTGDRDGIPDQDRLQDGSCKDLIQSEMSILTGKKMQTGDQDGTPDQDRAQDRDQDRAQDGLHDLLSVFGFYIYL